MHLTDEDIQRFWKYVNKDGPWSAVMNSRCWLWTGGVVPTGTGYGLFHPSRHTPGPRSLYAHRVADFLSNGPIAFGIEVCHACEYSLCVRHTFRGTHTDNMRDAMKKGRSVGMSSRHPRAKLTREQVDEIRSIVPNGSESMRSIAKRFGVTHVVVQKVVKGICYKPTSFVMR